MNWEGGWLWEESGERGEYEQNTLYKICKEQKKYQNIQNIGFDLGMCLFGRCPQDMFLGLHDSSSF